MADGKQLRTDVSQPARETYTITNATESRTINADSASNDQLSDILVTLLADLAALGLVDVE
jgi:hypothetical protein